MVRCSWCMINDIMIEYHDKEWGVPLHDDQKQFEFLMMEVMQCGLNWNMMLQKREIFRKCFDNFDVNKIQGGTNTKREGLITANFLDPSAVYLDPTADCIENCEYMVVKSRKTRNWIKRNKP